jgi:hypothetical protein
MIRFACGTCKERLVVPAHHAGRRGKCPNCGTVNRVPKASEFAGAEPGTSVPAVAPAEATQGNGPQLAPMASEVIRADPVSPRSLEEIDPAEPPARLVEVNLFDDAGMPVWMKLLIVAAILGVLVLGVWVVFYLLIWSHLKLTG